MDDVVKPLTTAWNEADVDTKNNKRISELEAPHKGQVSKKSTIEQTKHDHAPAVMATPTTGIIIIEEQQNTPLLFPNNNTQNQTLWFLGNSVSRIHAFVAGMILSDGEVPGISREKQKQICGRGGKYGGTRESQGNCNGVCGCIISKKSQPKVGFIWQQRISDAQLRKVLLGSDETYKVQQGDIIVLNVGLDDID